MNRLGLAFRKNLYLDLCFCFHDIRTESNITHKKRPKFKTKLNVAIFVLKSSPDHCRPMGLWSGLCQYRSTSYSHREDLIGYFWVECWWSEWGGGADNSLQCAPNLHQSQVDNWRSEMERNPFRIMTWNEDLIPSTKNVGIRGKNIPAHPNIKRINQFCVWKPFRKITISCIELHWKY